MDEGPQERSEERRRRGPLGDEGEAGEETRRVPVGDEGTRRNSPEGSGITASRDAGREGGGDSETRVIRTPGASAEEEPR